SCLFPAIGAIGHTGLGAHFVKSAMAVVVIKQARRGIVGYIQIEAAILVVIEPEHPKPVMAFGVDVQFFSDIGESAVSIIVIEPVAPTLQPAWPARNRNPSILAERALPEFRQMIQI